MFARGNRKCASGTYFGHWPRWEYWKHENISQILLSYHRPTKSTCLTPSWSRLISCIVKGLCSINGPILCFIEFFKCLLYSMFYTFPNVLFTLVRSQNFVWFISVVGPTMRGGARNRDHIVFCENVWMGFGNTFQFLEFLESGVRQLFWIIRQKRGWEVERLRAEEAVMDNF